jgi:hypothetical protein
MGAKSSVFGDESPLARVVGGLILIVARPLVRRTRFAFRGGSVMCSPRTPRAINTIGGGPVALH